MPCPKSLPVLKNIMQPEPEKPAPKTDQEKEAEPRPIFTGGGLGSYHPTPIEDDSEDEEEE